MYTYEVAPVATILEHKMIQHLNNLVWSKSGDGTMTSGGTASNLQALMTARHIHFPDLKHTDTESTSLRLSHPKLRIILLSELQIF